MIQNNNQNLHLPEEQETDRFLESIREKYGYDFRNYSRSTVNRRLIRFMERYNVKSLEELLDDLIADSIHFEYFIQEFTITVTEMFRDPGFFLSLRKNVLPVLSTYPHIRVWDAGCATGEELYSLAILFREENLLHKTTFYATDINQKALAAAREGIFNLSDMAAYSDNYLQSGGTGSLSDYYHSKYSGAIFDKSLVKNVVFYPHNLATDSSFNEFHLVVCRNVLIYFNKQLQENVFELFSNSIIPLCFLGLGSKETIMMSEQSSKFKVIDAKEKIYRYLELQG
ncbi:MAG: CheR family methyltransferase [Bacteroidota bacterium]